jgi:hypothetical protein
MTDHGPEYFAVPDPLDLSKMSYWYRPEGAAEVRPWPPRRSPWGRVPRSILPDGAPKGSPEWLAAVRPYAERITAAREAVNAEIAADPIGAAARFATLQVRCCCCGKRLTDERSRVYATGPDCRAGASPDWLASMVNAVARAHAEALAVADA